MSPDRRIVPFTTLVVLLAAGAVQAAVLAVPGSWPDLASALASARAGDVIELAPGTYAEYGLQVEAAVTIRGLGDQAGDVVIDGAGHGRLLTCEDVPGTITLLNLTLRGGAATGASTRMSSGGAVYAARSTVIAQNCIFEGNSAATHGGAVRFMASSGRLVQCTFRGNEAVLGGGAVDCSYGSSPDLERCTFSTNTGGWGGALSCRGDSSPAITRSVFLDNVASDLFGYGGGIFSDIDSSPNLEFCSLNRNRAAYGGALGCFQGSRMIVARCTMTGNSASGAGAGIYCIDGSPQVTASIVAYQNGTGVQSVGLALPELGCSNIYGNTGANVSGPVTSVPGVGPVISADPGFCGGDPANGVLTIDPASPSAESACGPMGAFPAACSLAMPQVATFLADAAGGTSMLQWFTTGDHAAAEYRLAWTRPGEPEREIVFRQTALNAFAATTNEPRVSDASVKFLLYGRLRGGSWLLLEDSGYSTGNDDGPGEGVPPAALPLGLRNWPNPFNPQTTIGLNIARRERMAVSVYGLDGRLVRRLADRVFDTGESELVWDGRDEAGRGLSSGTYVVRVVGVTARYALKITLLK